MARSLRLQFQGAIYHLTVRGNNHQRLFRDNHDRRYYLELLGRYKGRFGCPIYGYILLSNHLHLLLATPRASVGKFMQGLGTSYAAYFNRKYKRRGTVFAGRYESRLVPTATDLLEITRFIHYYALQEGSGKGWETYPWSSYRVYLGVVPSDLLDTATVLAQFRQASPEEQRQRYRKFVETGKLWLANPVHEQGTAYMAATDHPASLIRSSHPLEVSHTGANISDTRRAEGILRQVRSLDFTGTVLKESRRNALARHLAMYLIRKETLLPLHSIGSLLGVKASAVANAISKVERLTKGGAFPSQICNLLNSPLTAVSIPKQPINEASNVDQTEQEDLLEYLDLPDHYVAHLETLQRMARSRKEN